jgi:hypothetical protein
MDPRILAYLMRMGIRPPVGTSFDQASLNSPSAFGVGQAPSGALPAGNLGYENTNFMSVDNPSFYGSGGEQIASGQTPGATAASTGSTTSAGPDFRGAAMGAIRGALGAKDIGGQIRSQFAQQTGANESTLPKEPSFLSKRSQQEQDVATAAENLIPGPAGVVAKLATGVFRGIHTSGAADKYFRKLFASDPNTQEMGLSAPIPKPGVEQNVETALGGTNVGKGALGGAATGASVGSIVPGIGTAVGAVVGAIAGGLLGGRAKQKRKEAEKKAAAIAADNDVKMQAYYNQKKIQQNNMQTVQPYMQSMLQDPQQGA